MKKLAMALLMATALFQGTAQTKQTVNKTFMAEVGGPGILFSANFDSRFKPNERLGWGYKLGLGFTIVNDEEFTVVNTPNGSFTSFSSRTRSVATIPLGVNYLFGKEGSANIFEVSGGITLLSRPSTILSYNDYKERSVMGHFGFMYRRQPIEGGFAWKIGFVPIVNTDGDIFPFVGLGLGYAFK